jgi:signal transduction histidine kinase
MKDRLAALTARTPVRVQVALAFAAVMALLLGGTGLFLYLRLGSTLQQTVDEGLASRADDVAALVRQAGAGRLGDGGSLLAEQGEDLAQVLDARGRVVDAPPVLRDRPLIPAGLVRRATTRPVYRDIAHVPPRGDHVRVRASAINVDGHSFVVVVGSSLEPSEDAQRQLGGLLLIGGPVALLLASLAGYGAAAGALRPVEQMRRRAREIRAPQLGRRLPVPPSADEVARLGETLNEMLDRLERAFSRERRFVADASHELRTPLAILRGELELAARDAGADEELHASIVSAVEEVDRLIQLAEDLLVIARADERALPVRPERVEAGELLARVAHRFGARAAERGVELAVNAPVGLIVDADPLRLEQALGNLVDNALRYGHGRIELAAEDGAATRILRVRDDGPGLPEELLPVAFERFTRGDPARRRGGAGLGLAIVQAIAQAHGGRATARNTQAGGAEVALELPFPARDAGGLPPGRSAPQTTGTGAGR